MAERYWITGTQLGLLQATDKTKRKELVEEIIDKQFIGDKEHLDELLHKKKEKGTWTEKEKEEAMHDCAHQDIEKRLTRLEKLTEPDRDR